MGKVCRDVKRILIDVYHAQYVNRPTNGGVSCPTSRCYYLFIALSSVSFKHLLQQTNHEKGEQSIWEIFCFGSQRTSPCSGTSYSDSVSPDVTTLRLLSVSPKPNPDAVCCSASAAAAEVVTRLSFVLLSLSPAA